MLMISSDQEMCDSFLYKAKDYESAFEMYTPNFDENGYIHVNNFSINLSEGQDPNSLYVNNTKLFSEINLGIAHIFIGDKEQLNELATDENGKMTDSYEDLSLLYPNDSHIVDKYYYQIKGTPFAEAAMYGDCPDNIYIVLRKKNTNGAGDKNEENYNKAAEVLDNIVNDNKVSEEFPKK